MAKKAPDILGATLNNRPKQKPAPKPKATKSRNSDITISRNKDLPKPVLDPDQLMRYTIQATPERIKQLKRYALDNDLKLNEAIEQALSLLLD